MPNFIYSEEERGERNQILLLKLASPWPFTQGEKKRGRKGGAYGYPFLGLCSLFFPFPFPAALRQGSGTQKKFLGKGAPFNLSPAPPALRAGGPGSLYYLGEIGKHNVFKKHRFGLLVRVQQIVYFLTLTLSGSPVFGQMAERFIAQYLSYYICFHKSGVRISLCPSPLLPPPAAYKAAGDHV